MEFANEKMDDKGTYATIDLAGLVAPPTGITLSCCWMQALEAVAALLLAMRLLLLPVELVVVVVVPLVVVPFVADSDAIIGMSTLLLVVVAADAASRSSKGEMRAVLDLTGDTMEPIGEAEVADTDEEGGVDVGADKVLEDSGLANRTPSYWTPLNSIVTTSF
uniref:Uncharacterized protein n=1 Tax=Anopheles culicifacies TaxID=139723 RepID=A0A182M453_9DIPT